MNSTRSLPRPGVGNHLSLCLLCRQGRLHRHSTIEHFHSAWLSQIFKCYVYFNGL